MASANEVLGVSVPFAQALKAAFRLSESKIISAVSFDVIGMIPHLSESGIMEPNLRKLLIERKLVSDAKSMLVLHRIHEMGAYGYVRFVVLLQRNQSSVVYRKLAEQLLVTAQELYEAWRCVLCSYHHLCTSVGSVPKHGTVLCSSSHPETPSITRDSWTSDGSVTVPPDNCHRRSTFEEVQHDTSCRQYPVYQPYSSLHATSHRMMPARDTEFYSDAESLSVMFFTEENVFVLVKQFCESGGSQMEKIGKLLKMFISTCLVYVVLHQPMVS